MGLRTAVPLALLVALLAASTANAAPAAGRATSTLVFIDAESAAPLKPASVRIDGYDVARFVGDDGAVDVQMDPGRHSVEVVLSGYGTLRAEHIALAERTVENVFELVSEAKPARSALLTGQPFAYHVSGWVRGVESHAPIPFAHLSFRSATVSAEAVADKSGQYSLYLPAGAFTGSWRLEADAPGRAPSEMNGIDGTEVPAEFSQALVLLPAAGQSPAVVPRKTVEIPIGWEAAAALTQSAPNTISVGRGATRSTATGCTGFNDACTSSFNNCTGPVDTVSTELYVKRVLYGELVGTPIYTNAQLEAFKAMAVADRSFASYRELNASAHQGSSYSLCNSDYCQCYYSGFTGFGPTVTSASDQTAGQLLVNGSGNVVLAEYGNWNGTCDRGYMHGDFSGARKNCSFDSGFSTSKPLWDWAIDQNWSSHPSATSCANGNCGHSRGLSQYGAHYRAAAGDSYQTILDFYYNAYAYQLSSGGSNATYPSVTTNQPNPIGTTSATFQATVTNDGGSSIIDRRFEWGIYPNWTYATNVNGGTIVVSGNNFSCAIAGLQSNTLYQVRAWAKNSTGWTMADSVTFTTGSVSNCSFSLSPSSASPSSGANSGTFTVTGSPSGCSGTWSATASSSGNWLSLTGTTSGSGFGSTSVGYSYTANPSTTSSRTGTVAFSGNFPSGNTFTVTQSPATPPTCTYSFAQSSATVSGAAGNSSVGITGSPSGCSGSWSVAASSSGNWLTLTGTTTSSGSGSWTVAYSYGANPSTTSSRSGTISMSGSSSATYTVTQSPSAVGGCSYTIDPPSATASASAGTGTVTVTGSPSGCSGSWSAAASSSGNWLSLTGTTTGNGSGSWPVAYSFGANPSTTSSRSGSIAFSGSLSTTFTLTQAAAGGSGGNELIVDGGFESATATGNTAPGWQVYPSSGSGHQLIIKSGPTPHTGANYARLGGTDGTQFDWLIQPITIPSTATAPSLTLWLNVTTDELLGYGPYDFFSVVLYDTAGNFIATLNQRTNEDAALSNNAAGHYFKVGPLDLTPYKGMSVQLALIADTDSIYPTTFLVDDVSVQLGAAPPTPPAAPTGMAATALSTSSIKVSWTDNSNDETGFLIYRWNGAAWSLLTTAGANVTTYTDTGLLSATTYTYIACAQNDAGASCPSASGSATTTGGPPAQPTGMAAVALSTSSIKVSWTDNATNETAYLIYRWNGSTWLQIATLAANATTYTDSGLQPATAYQYIACAQNGAGSACPSFAGSATTQGVPVSLPAQPTGMTAVALSSSSIQVSWTDNATNETAYLIFRWTGSTWVQIATLGANATTYTDSGLQPATAYQHIACAQNSAGSTCPSGASSATTQSTASSIPAQPTGMSAAALSASSIQVSWTDNATNETNYDVYRWNGSTWIQIATLAANSVTYTDTGLGSHTTYRYIACARNGAGASCPSLYGSATTP